MVRGRRPTPTHLRVLQGNPQRRPMPKNEIAPRIGAEVPAPPAFLKGYAADEWRERAGELHALGVLTDIDVMIFAAYCQSVARWRLAEEALQRMTDQDRLMNGFIVRRQNGEAGPNPLVAAARRAAVEMLRFASEFGLSPVARARISSGKLGENKPISKFGNLLA
jgi:P27 family predicted phage terminase small subunit